MSDDDYRSLAAGYLSRTRVLLAELERRKGRLRLHVSALAILPPVALTPIADWLPKLDEHSKVWLRIGSLVLSIASAAFAVANQLADSRERIELKKSAARALIAELEAIPAKGDLSAWQRQLIDEANGTIKSLREFTEK